MIIPFSCLQINIHIDIITMAANKKNFDMQIKLLMIGDSGRCVS